jgi:alpha-mannosidase
VELTVWDWVGDLKRIQIKDFKGNPLPFQVLDSELVNYWDHKYVRVLVQTKVPGCGYTTVVLSEAELLEYPVYLQSGEQVARFFDDCTLENEYLRVKIDASSGRVTSMVEKATGQEMIATGEDAGLNLIDTETATSNAWNIGRHIQRTPLNKCLRLEKTASGELRNSVKATFAIRESKAEIVYSLEAGAKVLKMEMKVDWHEIGKETIPVLEYKVPLSYQTEGFLYDVPAGVITREALNNDVPALKFGLAKNGSGRSVAIYSDCKYGYRGYPDALGLTLINSSTSPDPYPERGIHTMTLWMGACEASPAQAEEIAWNCQHKLFYQPSNCHYGKLPMEDGLLSAAGENVFLSAVLLDADGNLLVRGFELAGEKSEVKLNFERPVLKAEPVKLFGEKTDLEISAEEDQICVNVSPYSIFECKIFFA